MGFQAISAKRLILMAIGLVIAGGRGREFEVIGESQMLTDSIVLREDTRMGHIAAIEINARTRKNSAEFLSFQLD